MACWVGTISSIVHEEWLFSHIWNLKPTCVVYLRLARREARTTVTMSARRRHERVALVGFVFQKGSDPVVDASEDESTMTNPLPEPRLTKIYRLEATLGDPLDLGETPSGHRRIVPLTGGTFRGPELRGKLLPGASADWQILLPDGTALGDIRYTLQTERGDTLYVQSQGIRHGSAEVLARLGSGEDVDASAYTFRTSTKIESAAADLDWLNKGVFISVAGRQPGAVVYEVYLVG
jgi:Protein of unknown function (DUF3237)